MAAKSIDSAISPAGLIRQWIVPAIRFAREKGLRVAVLAGRPYHIDPEVHHGIATLFMQLGWVVVSEDAVAPFAERGRLHVLNQWTFHARIYAAAHFAASQPDMDFVQLVSFGCGMDAISADEARDILENAGRIYTQLKIDEISNLGAARIRLRSLKAAVESHAPQAPGATIAHRQNKPQILPPGQGVRFGA